MGKDVIFDYSKAAAFIHEEEIAGIKAGVQAARDTLSPLLGQRHRRSLCRRSAIL